MQDSWSCRSDSGRPLLLAILANPPLTPGWRTLRRVELAREVLGYASVDVANLFAAPSQSTSAIAELGATAGSWLAARPQVQTGVMVADGVLLAYGVSSPVGPARQHYRQQVEWLDEQLASREVPVWTVGGIPRHPSRWQRWTSRMHPSLDFRSALALSLASREVAAPSAPPSVTISAPRSPHSADQQPCT